jgi:hypothetical protein
MKMNNVNALIIVIVLFSYGCSSNNINNDNCPDYNLTKDYNNENLRYSIKFPGDYNLMENYEILSLAAIKEHPDSNYFEACGVVVKNNLLKYRLKEHFQISFNNDKESYIEQYGEVKVIGTGQSIINGNGCYWSSFAYGKEKSLSYYFALNENLYTFIFISNNNDYDSLQCKFNSIANTLSFD